VWGKIFWAARGEIIGNRRKSYMEELCGLYSPLDIIWITKWRRMRLAGNVAYMNEMRNAYVFLMGKHEGKRPL